MFRLLPDFTHRGKVAHRTRYFLKFCLCVCVYVHVCHRYAADRGGQGRGSDPLELDLQGSRELPDVGC